MVQQQAQACGYLAKGEQTSRMPVKKKVHDGGDMHISSNDLGPAVFADD
jgi:hypothetical protein